MPFEHASSGAPATPSRSLLRWTSLAITALVWGVALFVLLLIGIRLIVFPHIADYRDTITAALARQLGNPVEVDSIAASWDGWNPKLEIRGVRIFDRGHVGAAPLLDLPVVELVVAWTSLPLLDLRLKELAIERPRLSVRRDRAGQLLIGGIEIDPGRASDDTRIRDWLLHQRRIIIRDAVVSWNDDLRNAPQLVLERVDLRFENRFGHHRFGLRGVPPAELAAPLDIRGDLTGDFTRSEGDSANAAFPALSGRIYTRLDYADVAAWRDWLPLPGTIASGKGALRVWYEFGGGQMRSLVADVELAGVRARVAPELPELTLAHLSGRLGASRGDGEQRSWCEHLAFATSVGRSVGPTDFSYAVDDATKTTRVEFDRIELEPLRELAAHLPLPGRVRDDLARYQPRGTLVRGRAQWAGDFETRQRWSASAGFEGLGIDARDSLPGGSGLSGSIDASQDGGRVKLASRQAKLDLPAIFAETIPADTLDADVAWERRGNAARIRVDGFTIANSSFAGSASGTWRRDGDGAGEIDADAHLARADVAAVPRFLPIGVDPAVRRWLVHALVAGRVDEARLSLAGPLAEFPFPDGKKGKFRVTAHTVGVTFDFAAGWPAMSDLDADVRFEGAGMDVTTRRARIYELEVGRTRGRIANLGRTPPVLEVEGSASGLTRDFLRYIAESPIAGWIDHVTDGTTAIGHANLELKFALPLSDAPHARVNGALAFANNQWRFTGVPELAQVGGRLEFTESEFHAHDVAVQVLGGPARLGLQAAGGRLKVDGAGLANLATLRREFAVPLAERVTGSTDWTFALEMQGEHPKWSVVSSTRGAIVDLPAPFGKTAANATPLRIEHGAAADGASLRIDYGALASIGVRDATSPGAPQATPGVIVRLGRATRKPEPAAPPAGGIVVVADLPRIELDEWLALARAVDTGGAGHPEFALHSFELAGDAVTIAGRGYHDLAVKGHRADRDWRLELRGREVAGEVTWTGESERAPSGRLSARLSKFVVPSAEPDAASASRGARGDTSGSQWPELDITAASFEVRGVRYGRLEVIAKPHEGEWRIERLVLANASGRIEASGVYRLAPPGRTELDLAVDIKDSDEYLAAIGHTVAVEDAPTKITGKLSWQGSPVGLDYPTLAGTLKVESGRGRFTKIDTGAGKLLGVLSLQALPRRIALDFRDIFSEGFAFDTIRGSLKIANGVMSSDDLKLAGPAAKVGISGDVDLERETQRMLVRVQPALSAGLSAGAALAFFANPLVGAAIGAGSLIAQKVLQDPLEQIFSYDYLVTGNWSDPLVVRVGSAGTTGAAPAGAAAGTASAAGTPPR